MLQNKWVHHYMILQTMRHLKTGPNIDMRAHKTVVKPVLMVFGRCAANSYRA